MPSSSLASAIRPARRSVNNLIDPGHLARCNSWRLTGLVQIFIKLWVPRKATPGRLLQVLVDGSCCPSRWWALECQHRRENTLECSRLEEKNSGESVGRWQTLAPLSDLTIGAVKRGLAALTTMQLRIATQKGPTKVSAATPTKSHDKIRAVPKDAREKTSWLPTTHESRRSMESSIRWRRTVAWRPPWLRSVRCAWEAENMHII